MNQPIQGQHPTSSYLMTLINILRRNFLTEALLTTKDRTLRRASSSNFRGEVQMSLAFRIRSLRWEEICSTRRNHNTRRGTCRTQCVLKCNGMASLRLHLWTYEVVHCQRALYALKLVCRASEFVDNRTTMLAGAKTTSSTKEVIKITKTSEKREGLARTQGSRTRSLSLEVARLQARAKSIFRISIMWYKTTTP